MPAHSAGVAIFLLFSRSLILQKYLFEQSKFYRCNQTHEEPDRELRVSGQIALQNRLIDSVVQSAEPHIQSRGSIDHNPNRDANGRFGDCFEWATIRSEPRFTSTTSFRACDSYSSFKAGLPTHFWGISEALWGLNR